MDRIVGNFLKILACIALLFINAQAEVTLRVTNMEGEQLEQAGAGQPFMLEVSIAKMGKGLSEPEIKGDPIINIQRTGLFMSTINGVSTTKYSYKVRIDEIGTFQLGPAIVMYQGAPVESNVLSIDVTQRQKSKDVSEKKAFLELKVDKDQVVVGQKINCTLTFYYTGDTVSLKQVGQPQLQGFSKQSEEEPITGKVKKDGEMYNYVRWYWKLYPTMPGKLVIPAHRADYVVELKKKQQGLGAFGFFFGNHVEHKRVYSNIEQIHVDSLPPYDGQIDAIGTFKHIHASIKPAIAKQGEAMVLTLEIEGDADLRLIKPPKLKHMPSMLKYYESKNYVVEPKNKHEQSKKYFEYIIQGLQEGDWQIPKQTFTYFDIDAYKYKKLETAPLMIQIVRNTEIVKQPPVIDNESVQEQKIDTHDIFSINEQGPWRPMRERGPLPLWLFLLFMCMPIIFLIYICVRTMIQHYYERHESRLRFEHAFKYASAQLRKAHQSHNAAQIYHIITQLFADRAQMPNAKVTQNNIETKLKNVGVSAERLQEWQLFFNTVAAHAFGHTKEIDNHLFEQAKQWIDYLKKLL
jgi:BatD DUF11 like domain